MHKLRHHGTMINCHTCRWHLVAPKKCIYCIQAASIWEPKKKIKPLDEEPTIMGALLLENGTLIFGETEQTFIRIE